MDWNSIRIGYGQHAFIVGHTGNGKSVLAKYLVNDSIVPYSVVYDAKHDDGIGDWPNQTMVHSMGKLVRYLNANREKNSEHRRLIYRPSFDDSEDKDQQNIFFRTMFERGGTRVYTDEVSKLVGTTYVCRGFLQCMQLGRSRGISMVNGCQRPSNITQVILSEATWFYIFKLNLRTDREKMEELTDVPQSEFQMLPKYHFLIHNAVTSQTYGPIMLNLKGTV